MPIISYVPFESAPGEDGSGLSNPDLDLTALSLSDGFEKQQSDHQGPTFRPLNLHLRDSGYVENIIPNDSTIKSNTLLEGQKQDLCEGSDVQESESKRQTTLIFGITNPLMHVSNEKADEIMLDSKFQALVAEDFIIANVKNVINKLGRLTTQVTTKIPQLATESLDATHPQLIDDSLDAKLISLRPFKSPTTLDEINAKVDDINANLEKLVQTLIEIMTSITSLSSVPVEG
ncbi:hypothetical protein Tco_1141466, partial [Tanacetum coccineum]